MYVSPSSHAAIVDVLPTSDPPVRSVIHWPEVQNSLGSREVKCASTGRTLSSPWTSRNLAAPSVIANGQL